MARGNSIPQKMPDRAVQNFTTKKHIHQRPLFYIKEVIENIFGGIIIGSTIFVGGINCGAMANIVSLYDKLIHSIGKLFKNFNYNFLLLLNIPPGTLSLWHFQLFWQYLHANGRLEILSYLCQ